MQNRNRVETIKTIAIAVMIAGMIGIALGVRYADNKNKAQVEQIKAAISQTQQLK